MCNTKTYQEALPRLFTVTENSDSSLNSASQPKSRRKKNGKKIINSFSPTPYLGTDLGLYFEVLLCFHLLHLWFFSACLLMKVAERITWLGKGLFEFCTENLVCCFGKVAEQSIAQQCSRCVSVHLSPFCLSPIPQGCSEVCAAMPRLSLSQTAMNDFNECGHFLTSWKKGKRAPCSSWEQGPVVWWPLRTHIQVHTTSLSPPFSFLENGLLHSFPNPKVSS